MRFSMFAEETQLERGDSLEKLKIIDFEAFRPQLEKNGKAMRADRRMTL